MSRKKGKWLKIRIISFMFVFVLLFGVLLYQAFNLQVVSSRDLKTLARKQHIKSLQLQPERGLILDCNGEKLAASIMMDSVCAEPPRIADQAKAASALESIFPESKGQILSKMKNARNFCWIARLVSPEQAVAVKSLKIEGVYLIKEPKRVYPNKMLAGPLIGFVGVDSNGLEGLELRYDNLLKRKPEEIVWARDAKGNSLFMQESLTAKKKDKGYNILLTIDSRIQYLVDSQLNEAVQRTGAKGGLAVAMDPKTGAILAMSQEPGFNPNTFHKTSAESKKNRAVADSFDPGSTFKPFVAASALEEGVVKETDRFNCENGSYQVANRVFHEAQRHKYGSLTFREVLKYSSNIGSIKISQKLGKEKFYKYITDFGFGSKTGIDLPGEASGILRHCGQWTTVDASAIAFGQGISVTAIQITTALAAIANGGLLMKPYIVRGFTDAEGNLIKEFPPTVVRRVISNQTAGIMASVLTDVVGAPDGTGKRAKIENIPVAGKTGTSQKFDFAAHKYSSERVRTSFMGFFPADNPKVVLFVMIDEPKRDKWGGVAAAPVFRNISEQILRRYERSIGENPIIEERQLVPETGIRLVSAAENSSADETSKTIMPDFRGLTMKKAVRLARERGIELKVEGSGWAVSQAPSPGAALGENPACKVSFER